MRTREIWNRYRLHQLLIATAVVLGLLFWTAVGAFGAEPAPQFTVVNKCPPTFTVTNRMPAPAKPVASQGCGCTASSNCGASFCKARGGKSGCGDACPVKAVVAEPVQVAFPYQTYQSPSCANGQCSSGRTGWYPGKLLGR